MLSEQRKLLPHQSLGYKSAYSQKIVRSFAIDYIMEQPGDSKYLEQVLVTGIYAPLVDG